MFGSRYRLGKTVTGLVALDNTSDTTQDSDFVHCLYKSAQHDRCFLVLFKYSYCEFRFLHACQVIESTLAILSGLWSCTFPARIKKQPNGRVFAKRHRTLLVDYLRTVSIQTSHVYAEMLKYEHIITLKSQSHAYLSAHLPKCTYTCRLLNLKGTMHIYMHPYMGL